MCSLAQCMTKWPLHCTNRCILASSCRGLKETTGLVGLEVDPEARSNVLTVSQQVLAAVAEKIPKEAQYRANVEATMEHWIEKVRLQEIRAMCDACAFPTILIAIYNLYHSMYSSASDSRSSNHNMVIATPIDYRNLCSTSSVGTCTSR
jgi:ETC complex I subunit conserved region